MANTLSNPSTFIPNKRNCKPIILWSRQDRCNRKGVAISFFNNEAKLTLQMRVLARELSTKVMAEIPAASKALTPAVNLLMSSVLGGSSSAIIVTSRLTQSTKVFDELNLLISYAYYTIDITSFFSTGLRSLLAL